MPVKKFKDLSSFGFCRSVIEKSSTAPPYAKKENNIGEILQTTREILVEICNSIVALSDHDHTFPTDQSETTGSAEFSSVVDSTGMKNDIGNYINDRLSLPDESDDRLNGLAVMYIHSMIEVDVEQVIDEFSRRKNRKLDFHI